MKNKGKEAGRKASVRYYYSPQLSSPFTKALPKSILFMTEEMISCQVVPRMSGKIVEFPGRNYRSRISVSHKRCVKRFELHHGGRSDVYARMRKRSLWWKVVLVSVS